jgi:hypothetical protein
MASAVTNPAAPRSERHTQNRVVDLFRDTLGYRNREQAMVHELLTGRMRLV